MITVSEILMGRVKFEDLTPEHQLNLCKLMVAINKVRDLYGKPMTLSSGYRDPAYNKSIGGAPNSWHTKGGAIDIADPEQKLQKWILANKERVKATGLQLEGFKDTPSWVHFDVGNRPGVDLIFNK